eukprot:Protomagalhaensia_wolfi_Nauph_80__2188@NODE_2411_length_1100_cov_56_523091_g1887_i0_p1_GENE_NODE_2411_length_1100_cov_56_523091_g1887_i0NODE_2411_length_1100_cov_56_523091_g1887_i0_p1_ORF_typecomplete_len340_score35_49SpoU_methylase/PF00588_19/1e04SpoU_methylase/PF00588_19/4_8e30_NODE_2411_length_1100_cov_56_523091_g1887_i0741093
MKRLPPAVVQIENELTPASRWIGENPVYEIEDPDDGRLAFFRLTKCRDHRYYSCLHNIMLQKGLHFVLALTKTVVQRALLGHYEVVSLMLTQELLEEMKEMIQARRLIEGVYVISRDNYEKIVGLIVNASQACAALVDVRAASEPLPLPVSVSLSERRDRYFWRDDCQFGLDRRPAADELQTPVLILDDVRSAANVGVIMRTAFSLGVRSIIATPTSFSAINCRASRTSMGGLFFFSIWKSTDSLATVQDLRKRGIHVYATSPRGNLLTSAKDDNWALILGNEAEGSSDEVLKEATECIRIPQAAGDSLSVSVAAGICLYGLRREVLQLSSYMPQPDDL